ncbi:MAG: hypothetical protein ABI434_13210 [Burkholderiaceae bacterium]
MAKLQYDLEHAMAEAQEAFSVAKGKDNAGAMVQAITLRAKLNRLLIERNEVTITEVQKLDDESLDRLIALKAVEAGIVAAPEPGSRGQELH